MIRYKCDMIFISQEHKTPFDLIGDAKAEEEDFISEEDVATLRALVSV